MNDKWKIMKRIEQYFGKTKRFMLSCKEGDFIVVECVKEGIHRVGSKMIICYGGKFFDSSNGPKWHSATAKFLINLGNNFRINANFGIDATCFIVRKPTIKEYFVLMRELKKHGLIYNKKKKELCPIMTL